MLSKIIFVLAALFVALACASEESVVVLTAENFDTIVNGQAHVFVKLFAPWCGHCKKMAPDWVKLAEAYEAEGTVIIAEVDCDDEPSIRERFDVKGFPTLKYFGLGAKTDEPEPYQGARELNDLAAWVHEKTGLRGNLPSPPPDFVLELTPSTFANEVYSDDKHVFVEFYAPWCGHCKALAPVWIELAEAFRAEPNVVIAKLDASEEEAADIKDKFEITGFPTLKLFKAGDNDSVTPYTSARGLQELVDFVNKEAGTERTTDGRPGEYSGRIDSFDELADGFVALSTSEQTEREAAAKKLLDGLSDDQKFFGKVYVKAFSSIAKDGKSFIASEKARLEKMAKASRHEKRDRFYQRQNILTAFEDQDDE